VPMMEVFVAADHGGTVTYEHVNESYKPVLKQEHNITGNRWGVLIQQEAIRYLAQGIVKNGLDLNEALDLDDISFNLSEFILRPTKLEAQAYGSYPLSEEQNEAYYFPLAKRYTLADLLKHKRTGFIHHHNEWVQGALALSNGTLQQFVNRVFSNGKLF
jgi:hypothetical protein